MRSLTVTLVALALLVGACGSDDDGTAAPTTTDATTRTTAGSAESPVPDRAPDLLGTITAVDEGIGLDGLLGTILVEGDLAPERGRKITYTVTTDTTITGTVGDFGALADGQLAETWAAGPCAESYPEQCTLAAIRVLG